MNAGYEYREQIGTEAAGRTVLAWLLHRYRHSTEATWRERIASGEVYLDGEAALAMDVLPVVPLGFALLHRDEDLLAVAKPRGRGGLARGPRREGDHLHSHRLALVHPATGRRLELECLPPPELRA